MISKADQVISFAALTAKTYGDVVSTLTATGGASSNGIVFSSTNTAVATVSGDQLTIIGPGTANIVASQAGTANYNAAADVSRTLVVNKAAASIALADLIQTYNGTARPVSATTTPSSLSTVSITYNGSSTAPTAAGTYTVVASLNNSNYAAADAVGTLVINKAAQSITFGTLASKVYGDANVTLGATGGLSGNTVTYSSANTAVATVSGNTLTIIAPGTVNITASQAGNTNYNPAADVVQSFTVGKAGATIVLSNLTYTYDGTSKAATANITPAVGIVTITYNGSTTTPTTVGSYNVLASLNNANYAATDVTGTLTIGKAAQTITFAALANKAINAVPFALSATGGASGNAIIFTSSDETVATVSGSLVTIVGPGTTNITAAQAGSTNYSAATDVIRTLTVTGKINQVINFAALGGKSLSDAPFALTATGGASGNPVTYVSSNTAIATVNSNIVTVISEGTTNITASQAGNATYNPAADVVQSLTVNGKLSQTIVFAALPAKAISDAPFALTATGGSSGNAVTFTSSNPSVATIIGTTITITGAGTTTITAAQAGNATYNAATDVLQTLTVTGKLGQTINFTALPAKAISDAPFSLNATGGASGNPVTFTSSNPAVATVAGFIVTIVGEGTTNITAAQAGNATYDPAANVIQTLTVGGKLAQAITFAALTDRSLTDGPFTLSATGGASGNPVTFTSSNLAVATVTGNLVTIIGVGTTTITAAQAGNSTFNAAPAATQTLTVNGKLGQAITFAPPAAKAYGDAAFSLTATGGASGNPVTYTSSNALVATIIGNIVTITGPGTATITAAQAGNANYNAAANVTQTLTVSGVLNQTITFAALADQTYGAPAFALSATGGQSGNAVTFTSSNTAVATVSGNTVTIVGAGTTNITANQAGNANYNAASAVIRALTVNKADPVIAALADVTKTYGNASFVLTAPVSNSNGAITFASSTTAVATIAGSMITITGAGTTVITAAQAATANYNAGSSIMTLTVGKAMLTITADNKAKVQN
ncbi:MAG: hypothetical protein EOP51_21025, partial [Sphingobacteriales bacterium]